MSLDLETVADGLGFPEGPVALASGSLLFVDIKNETLARLGVDGRVEVVAEIPGGPNGAAIGPDGAAYVCNNGGAYRFVPFGPGNVTVPMPDPANFKGGSVQRVDLVTGKITLLFNSYKGKRLLALDDIVFDKSGGFWFTETGIQDDETLQKGALYYATIDGQTLERVATIPMANGVGLSPDGHTIYVSDTIFGRLWALDIIESGEGEGGTDTRYARPGHTNPPGLSVAGQSQGRGEWARLRWHDLHWGHHRFQSGRFNGTRRRSGPLHNQPLLWRLRHAGPVDHGVEHRQDLQDPLAAARPKARVQCVSGLRGFPCSLTGAPVWSAPRGNSSAYAD